MTTSSALTSAQIATLVTASEPACADLQQVQNKSIAGDAGTQVLTIPGLVVEAYSLVFVRISTVQEAVPGKV